MVTRMEHVPTGAVNGAIAWAFAVGDRVKIRLVNVRESDHPMAHCHIAEHARRGRRFSIAVARHFEAGAG